MQWSFLYIFIEFGLVVSEEMGIKAIVDGRMYDGQRPIRKVRTQVS